MTKTDFINNIVYSMAEYLTTDGIEYLKTVIRVNLVDVELAAAETLPSTEVYDNEYILKRYIIDLTAKGRKRSTINQYVTILKKFFRETGLNYYTCTGQQVMDYLAIMQYKGKISKSYAETLQKYLSTFFRWAYMKKHIPNDVSVDIDKIKAPQKNKERLTDEEIVRASMEIAGDVKLTAFFELMLSAGPRVGEIANMRIENLDFDRQEIRIWGEKTSQWRTCFMNERCKQALKKYIGQRKEGPVFTGRSSTGGISENTFETMAKKIGIIAGCRFNTTVHSYRKTYASREYRRTKDVLYVSKRLGHSSTDVTIKYYICDDIELDRLQANLAA
ncbi:MAG: tyrosine-type recombinase/integrase [Lachnobacterium sp.]|nr:tyrosine-type recombinase/integrase [Lachnobacterium sp.]